MRFFRTKTTIDQLRDMVSGKSTIDNIRFLMLNRFFGLSSYLTRSLFSIQRSPISETALLFEGEYGAMMELNWHGQTEALQDKPVTVSLCPPRRITA
jgi:hypothetical protein